MHFSAALIGFMMGASLIIAIGPQNAFLLRQGLKRAHVFKIALFCSLSDFLLMAGGVYGLAVVAGYSPYLLPVMKWGGCLFLFGYGVLSFRRALHEESLAPVEGRSPSLKAIFLQLFAFTYLNPHVYMDTFLLLGSVAQSQPAAAKLSFLLGAAAASFAWFFMLGYGARVLTPFFKKPLSWRILDVVIGVIMMTLSATLFVKY